MSRLVIPVLGLVFAVAACSSPISNGNGPTGPELPPLGLASTAIWLENREALTAQSIARAAEVRAAQRAEDQQRAAAIQPQPAAEPQPTSTSVNVSDSTLRASAINGFATGCIANAPRFGAAPPNAFGALKPIFDAGLTLESSGTRRSSCEYRFVGYGTNRARPTSDQMVLLAQTLQERVGGNVTSPQSIGNGLSISVENANDVYTLQSTVDERGTLNLSVSR